MDKKGSGLRAVSLIGSRSHWFVETREQKKRLVLPHDRSLKSSSKGKSRDWERQEAVITDTGSHLEFSA